MDEDLYYKCEREFEQSNINREHEAQERQLRWDLIEQAANKLKTNENHVEEMEMQVDKVVPHIPEAIPEAEEPIELESEKEDIQMSGVNAVETDTVPSSS
jgi:hypothetical protein